MLIQYKTKLGIAEVHIIIINEYNKIWLPRHSACTMADSEPSAHSGWRYP